MSGRPTASIIAFSTPAPFFLTPSTISVRLRPIAAVIEIAIADSFPQSPQPVASPGKFDAQYCKPDRDYDQRRARRDDHDDSQQQHGRPDDRHDDAPRRFVSNVNCSLHSGICSALLAFAACCRSLGTMIKLLRLPCLLVPMLSPVAVFSSDGGAFAVQVKESIATLEPGDAIRREIRLPAIDVAIVTSIECPANATAFSLIVSVSDTHKHYGPEALADAVSLEAALTVPAHQLAPVVIPEFCVKGAPVEEQSLRLDGVATAQLSMRCRDENDSATVQFTSVPIPVWLYCSPDGEPESPSTDK